MRTKPSRPRRAADPAAARRPQMLGEPRPPFPRQHLDGVGLESQLRPAPRFEAPRYKPAAKLAGKVALVTGGDSGIGRAVACLFAREGADVAIGFLPRELGDARVTRQHVEAAGGRCLLLPRNLSTAAACRVVVERTVAKLGRLDILVVNAAHQNRKDGLAEVTDREFDLTFKTNMYAYFWLARAALRHLRPGGAIIATSSETGILGSEYLPDYSATKGAMNAFTKALAVRLIKRGIRVNAVAPGPVWTPLNAADDGHPAAKVAAFGKSSPMGRPAQPEDWRRPTCSSPPTPIRPTSPAPSCKSWEAKPRAVERGGRAALRRRAPQRGNGVRWP